MWDSLERRQLLSSSLSSGVLTITGTSSANTIDLTVSGSNIVVDEHTGSTHSYLATSVNTISIDAKEGNDKVTVSNSILKPCTIYGGAGNDTAKGGGANDLLSGGSGNDELHGQNGNDIIRGDADVDACFGEAGNDVLDGGAGNDYLDGSSGNDTADFSGRTNALSFRVYSDKTTGGELGLAESDNINAYVETVIGGAGGETFTYGGLSTTTATPTTRAVRLEGRGGNDIFISKNTSSTGIVDTTIVGGTGSDTADYSAFTSAVQISLDNVANDGLASNAHDNVLNDVETVFGGSGNDVITGSASANSLKGNGGNDAIRGSGGNDILDGGTGNDDLYGGSGSDRLNGGDGIDGLFGDSGTDSLQGNAGSDRFLQTFATGATVGVDSIVDAAGEDAICSFRNSSQQTLVFAGQVGSYTFAAGFWSDSEIENIDLSLGLMQRATGNDNLLERNDGSALNYSRAGAQIASDGGYFSAAAWNSGGNITFADGSFSSGDSFVREVVLHETGHNWDEEFDAAGWRSRSGWTQVDQRSNPNYVQGLDASGTWWHLSSAQFVSGYAQTNPNEDFAETFAAYFANRAGWVEMYGTTITLMPGKYQFMSEMVTALS
jgi:Ca2+-binding RTX toxin-like protein